MLSWGRLFLRNPRMKPRQKKVALAKSQIVSKNTANATEKVNFAQFTASASNVLTIVRWKATYKNSQAAKNKGSVRKVESNKVTQERRDSSMNWDMSQQAQNSGIKDLMDFTQRMIPPVNDMAERRLGGSGSQGVKSARPDFSQGTKNGELRSRSQHQFSGKKELRDYQQWRFYAFLPRVG